jgi:capsular exopolysaccharide synthesis family protein
MELVDYWRIIRRHWLGIVAIVVAAVAIAAAFTLAQPRVYSADAGGFVSTGPADNPALSSVNDQLAKSRATSYVDIARSRATAQAVIDDLDLDVSPASLVGRITVTQPRDTVLLKVTAKGSTPEEAQQLADAWVRAMATQVAQIEDPKGTNAPGVPQVLPVEAAALPGAPSSPNVRLNLALGLLLGLMLGLGYALLRHTLDRKLRSKEDIEERFGVSVVGAVPDSPVLAHATNEPGRIAVDDEARTTTTGPASEAFRKLRTNLMYMDVDNPPRVVVVTSPLPGDGKSTVAANLAATIDSSGQDVVLVDGDLRRPMVATWFGLAEGVGLTDVLAGRIGLDEALQAPAAHPNLRVLAAGAIPPNPSELLGSQAMRTLLQKLSAQALVVVDAPPLLPVTDAAVLTAQSDGAFVVVSAGRTLDTQLASALDHLAAVDARPLGVVLNRISRRDAGSGYYDHYRGYYERDSARDRSEG